MKAKFFTTVLLMLFSVLAYAEVSKMVAVSADGDKTSYVLADIQRIDVNSTETTASMSVLLKDGSLDSGYTKLLFAKVETGIEELGISSVYVYPNPVVNTLYIQGVDDAAALSVYNLAGKCLMQEKGAELNVSSLNQGTYILRINETYVKFIKK